MVASKLVGSAEEIATSGEIDFVKPGTIGENVYPAVVELVLNDGTSKLVKLREAAKTASARTEAARSKKRVNAAKRVAAGKLKWQDVRAWFEKYAAKHIGLSRLPSWGPKDRQNARRMIAEFDAKEFDKATEWFFEHWEAYRRTSRGRLTGIPTPSLMIAMKSQVFPDCELGKVPGHDEVKAKRVLQSEWNEDAYQEKVRDGSFNDWGLD